MRQEHGQERQNRRRHSVRAARATPHHGRPPSSAPHTPDPRETQHTAQQTQTRPTEWRAQPHINSKRHTPHHTFTHLAISRCKRGCKRKLNLMSQAQQGVKRGQGRAVAAPSANRGTPHSSPEGASICRQMRTSLGRPSNAPRVHRAGPRSRTDRWAHGWRCWIRCTR